MSKTLKIVGYFSAIAIFFICLTAGIKTLNASQEKTWQGLALFMIAMSIFAAVGLIILTYNIKTPQVKTKSAAPKPAQAPKKTNVEEVIKEIKKKPIRKESDKEDSQKTGPTNIYVGNLAPAASEADLREEFGVFGTVKTVRIISDKETGEPKGYAFIEMYDHSDAKLAVEDIDGQEIKGQAVKVTFAKPKPRRGRPRNKRA